MKTRRDFAVRPIGARGICLAVMGALCLIAAGSAAAPQMQPQPRNAVNVILSAFDRVPVVALGGALHGTQTLDDFALDVARDPRFSAKVSNVAIECGNSRYQDVLDRYVAGADVPLSQVQPAWRNTTQMFGCNAAEQQTFIVAVRELNRHRAPNRRIRVLAGDPPIDWGKVRTAADVNAFLRQRDANFAAVVEDQVLAKHEKALLLIGDLHVVRSTGISGARQNITMMLESKYRHSTYVVTSGTFGERNGELEPRLAKWPVPSIATIRGTWLGSLDPFLIYDVIRPSDPSKVVNPFPGMKLQDLTDAYLYLGPAASIHEINRPEETDKAYAQELARRRKLMMGGSPMRVIPAPAPTK